MRLFLDTSALAKRYVAEDGSDALAALCEKADELLVSAICWPELISTLSRLVREKRLSKANYRKIKAQATADWVDMRICELNPGVHDAATSLLEAHPLRAMDALHIACALLAKPDQFASADQRQLDAAKKAGLNVVALA